jgi:hypothetical protein
MESIQRRSQRANAAPEKETPKANTPRATKPTKEKSVKPPPKKRQPRKPKSAQATPIKSTNKPTARPVWVHPEFLPDFERSAKTDSAVSFSHSGIDCLLTFIFIGRNRRWILANSTAYFIILGNMEPRYQALYELKKPQAAQVWKRLEHDYLDKLSKDVHGLRGKLWSIKLNGGEIFLYYPINDREI